MLQEVCQWKKALLDVFYIAMAIMGQNAKVFIQCFRGGYPKKSSVFELGTDLPLIMLIYKPEQATEQALDEYAKIRQWYWSSKGAY